MKSFIFFISFIFLGLCGCKQPSTKVVEHGFYYWKTEFKLSSDEKQSLEKLNVTKLYIRFFDVVYDTQIGPIARQPIVFIDKVPDNINVVPVVFITNETILQMDSNKIPVLAGHITRSVNTMAKNNLKSAAKEIQIDCDWSVSTKEKYFKLLREIRDSLTDKKCIVSVTIRLYQAKYQTLTGIPPVSRGTLMVYNMGQLTNPATTNSIMDIAEEKKYLTVLEKYPLKLDVVLPIFYWGVLFRDTRFAGILNNLDEKTLKDNVAFRKEEANNYRASYETQLNNYSILNGDRIRLESCTEKDMEESISLISSKNKTDTLCLSFFSLDSQLINSSRNEKISQYYSDYR